MEAIHPARHSSDIERTAWWRPTGVRPPGRALWGIAFLCGLLGFIGEAWGFGPVTLTWDPNPEPNVAGYILRYGTATRVYTQIVNVGNTTTWTTPDLPDGSIVYFVVSAYNAADLEGPASLETNTNPQDTVLASLTLSAGMLQLPLAGGTGAYSVYVPDTTTSVVLTPTTQDSEATLTVNGIDIVSGTASQSIALDPLTTVVTIVVTAKDMTTTQTYTVQITRLTPIEMWRQTYFGSPANAGPGADTAIPQKDGITNLMKFATVLDPTRPVKMPGTLTKGTQNLTFKYTRSVGAVNSGLIFTVEWSDTMAPANWSASGVTETTVLQGDEVKVTATIPAGTSKRRFVRLVVTAP